MKLVVGMKMRRVEGALDAEIALVVRKARYKRRQLADIQLQ